MDPNRNSKNPFLDPDYLDENERTEEEKLRDLAMEMTRNGSLTILGSSSRSRNPIMRADFVETHEVINQDRLVLEAEEIRRDAQLLVNGVMRPLNITEVTRVNDSNYSKPLKISHRTELRRSTELDWDASRNWSCSFCGTEMKEHSWSSPNINPAGNHIPANCSLHLLFSKIYQDLFPGLRMIFNNDMSHLNNPRFIKFVFDQVDEQSNVMSKTWVDMLYEKPKEPERRGTNNSQALKIDMQLKRIKFFLRYCTQRHKLCKSETLPIPAKRVLDLSSLSTGIVRLVETSGIVKPFMALSHCWGPPSRHPLMTRRATLEEHKTGIALSSLPQSFRDAIKVCSQMDIQYIWIDCLCIVQDDGYESTILLRISKLTLI